MNIQLVRDLVIALGFALEHGTFYLAKKQEDPEWNSEFTRQNMTLCQLYGSPTEVHYGSKLLIAILSYELKATMPEDQIYFSNNVWNFLYDAEGLLRHLDAPAKAQLEGSRSDQKSATDSLTTQKKRISQVAKKRRTEGPTLGC